MRTTVVTLVSIAFLLGACVDMGAVSEFAKQSGQVAANKPALDASAAQGDVYMFAGQVGSDRTTIEDPTSLSFKQQQAVTDAALDALSSYMAVLANLSSKNTTAIGADISSISTSLSALNVADARVKSGLSAAQALANLLTRGSVRYTTRSLIAAAADPVDRVTDYLASQADVVANTYTNLAVIDFDAWSRLRKSTPQDDTLCATSNLCPLVYRLGYKTSVAEAAAYRSKALAATKARTAFQKIRKDNAALVAHLNDLTAQQLVDELKADEPDLQKAIQGLQGATS